MDFDVIVVGGRVAGSVTAMLLSRAGLRVLVVDRARFSSDTLSTHQVQLPGAANLHRWGVLNERIIRAIPPARHVTFDTDPVVPRGSYAAHEGVDAVYSSRRTVLDKLLIDAAARAGAAVQEAFVVEHLVADGVRGRVKGGGPCTITAPLIVGDDGKHSTIAREVKAWEYRMRPNASAACYAYFEGLPVRGGEVYTRPDCLVSLWPTGDELTIVFASMPLPKFEEFRHDFQASVSRIANLGKRVAAATMIEHPRGTTDLPAVMRQPYEPGWALVGDAGLVMHLITGQRISNTLSDAEALSTAIVTGGPQALADLHRHRDVSRRPMYDLPRERLRSNPIVQPKSCYRR